MGCGADPTTCRRDHIARRLDGATSDGGDYEARCPVCGHGGFRISRPGKPQARAIYRNIWTCSCRRCRSGSHDGTLRAALLSLDISAACLGIYSGGTAASLRPEHIERIISAVDDVLAVPGRKPSDLRIMLAEARWGTDAPEEYADFIPFAIRAGVGRRQAYEAAERWGCRPSGGHPSRGGGSADAKS